MIMYRVTQNDNFPNHSHELRITKDLKMFVIQKSWGAIAIVLAATIAVQSADANIGSAIVIGKIDNEHCQAVSNALACLDCCQLNKFNGYEMEQESKVCACISIKDGQQLVPGMSRLSDVLRAEEMRKRLDKSSVNGEDENSIWSSKAIKEV
jgi:hypothetical protein